MENINYKLRRFYTINKGTLDNFKQSLFKKEEVKINNQQTSNSSNSNINAILNNMNKANNSNDILNPYTNNSENLRNMYKKMQTKYDKLSISIKNPESIIQEEINSVNKQNNQKMRTSYPKRKHRTVFKSYNTNMNNTWINTSNSNINNTTSSHPKSKKIFCKQDSINKVIERNQNDKLPHLNIFDIKNLISQRKKIHLKKPNLCLVPNKNNQINFTTCKNELAFGGAYKGRRHNKNLSLLCSYNTLSNSPNEKNNYTSENNTLINYEAETKQNKNSNYYCLSNNNETDNSEYTYLNDKITSKKCQLPRMANFTNKNFDDEKTDKQKINLKANNLLEGIRQISVEYDENNELTNLFSSNNLCRVINLRRIQKGENIGIINEEDDENENDINKKCVKDYKHYLMTKNIGAPSFIKSKFKISTISRFKSLSGINYGGKS